MTLPIITKKQQEIIHLILTFRFLNSNQIQAFLKHKNKKNINTWLPDLVIKQYLTPVPKPKSFESKIKPTEYHIGLNGIRTLKNIEDIPVEYARNLYREKLKKSAFRKRCFLLANICLSFLKETTKTGTKYQFETYWNYMQSDSIFNFLVELKPHLCIIKHSEGKKRYFLLEIFDETLPLYMRKKRIKSYMEFFDEYEWENNINGQFPNILIVCPMKSLLISSKRMTKALLEKEENEDISFRFTTVEKIQNIGVTGSIWEKVMYMP